MIAHPRCPLVFLVAPLSSFTHVHFQYSYQMKVFLMTRVFLNIPTSISMLNDANFITWRALSSKTLSAIIIVIACDPPDQILPVYTVTNLRDHSFSAGDLSVSDPVAYSFFFAHISFIDSFTHKLFTHA